MKVIVTQGHDVMRMTACYANTVNIVKRCAKLEQTDVLFPT